MYGSLKINRTGIRLIPPFREVALFDDGERGNNLLSSDFIQFWTLFPDEERVVAGNYRQEIKGEGDPFGGGAMIEAF